METVNRKKEKRIYFYFYHHVAHNQVRELFEFNENLDGVVIKKNKSFLVTFRMKEIKGRLLLTLYFFFIRLFRIAH